ncbi:hypothetical protein ACFL27_06435 [candidate division CSSED10-310 bacterium]|uniref:DUF5689 domain-containing protein n=1 Tax=candidate division CSSED10-310 bacterium TaxID=2855610 RepID=A0ABV6YUE3_UNCC1
MLKKIISLLIIVITLQTIACLDDVSQDQSRDTAQIVCQIGLTEAMKAAYTISQIRLTILQGSSIIWGPNTYDYSLGQVDVTGVTPGNGYHVFAEVLDTNSLVVCQGDSLAFNAVAGQLTNAGYIRLGCLAIVLSIEPDPVPYNANRAYWSWEENLEEMAGVPATFVTGYYEALDQNFELISGTHNNLEVSQFMDWYNECDNNNGKIGAYGTLCGRFNWSIWETSTGGYYVEYLKFRDDNGMIIEMTVTVRMLAQS